MCFKERLLRPRWLGIWELCSELGHLLCPYVLIVLSVLFSEAVNC
jgi:hypothetical protein